METDGKSLKIDCGADYPISVLAYGQENLRLPVILLHGLESHAGWFSRSCTALAEAGHPVYAMDRRGSGHSEAPRGWCGDFRELLEDLNALADWVLERHRHHRFHLVGHCFGAVPATAYACLRGVTLQSLILSTPAIYTRAGPPLFDRLKILWAGLSKSRLQVRVPLRTEWFTRTQEILEFISNDPLKLHEASGRIFWETLRARRFIHAREDALSMPLFLGLAGEDRICDNTKVSAFFDRLPSKDKRVHSYPDAIHILEYSDARDAYFEDLQDWMSLIDKDGERLM